MANKTPGLRQLLPLSPALGITQHSHSHSRTTLSCPRPQAFVYTPILLPSLGWENEIQPLGNYFYPEASTEHAGLPLQCTHIVMKAYLHVCFLHQVESTMTAGAPQAPRHLLAHARCLTNTHQLRLLNTYPNFKAFNSAYLTETLALRGCYGLNCAPSPNSYIEAINPSVMVFGDGGLWEVISFR